MSSVPTHSAPDWPPIRDGFERPLFKVTYARLSDDDARYWIPAHVYVCATHTGGVVLDLRHDKYFGLTRPQMHALQTVVQAWPAMSSSASNRQLPPEATNALASALLSRGALTKEKQGGSNVKSPPIRVEHTMSDIALDSPATCRISLHHLWNYARSLLCTLWMLRRHTLERVAQRIANRREKALQSNRVIFDSAKAAELAKVFRILKTVTHRGHEKCLLDSLCLLEFLACYGLHPQWVIGVTAAPFTAHSWVQEQHYILGGSPEQTIYAFTPIMVV